MDKKIKIVTVFVEKDAVTCECVCPVMDVDVGDYVQIFLNNAPTIGEVQSVKDIPINELSSAVYEMKSVIRKVPNPAKTASMPRNTIRVNDFIRRNRTITLVGRGILGKFAFSNAEVEAHNVEVGDSIYFTEADGSLYLR